MARKTPRPRPLEGKKSRDKIRDELRRRGKVHIDQIASAMRETWAYTPMEAYRRAKEWTQPDTTEVINTGLGLHDGDPGWVDQGTYSRYERWPYLNTARHPAPPGVLIVLANEYPTDPMNLVDPAHFDKYSAQERVAIRAASASYRAKGSEPDTSARMMEVSRLQAGEPDTPWFRPDEIRSGTTLERIVIMTGDEAARYADRPSTIGEVTIDQLRTETAELARGFGGMPKLPMFGRLRLLRDRLFAYLDSPGRTGTTETRDLHFLAASVSGMLSSVTNDLGYPGAAFAHLRVGKMLAKEAGSNDLRAWLLAEQATRYYWNGQYSKARESARAGQDLHPNGTVAIYLPAVEARSTAEFRDRRDVQSALNRTTEARNSVQVGALDEYGGYLSFDQAKQQYYAAETYLGIGDNQNAIAEATASERGYETGPADGFSQVNVTLGQIRAATAHVSGGDLDAAKATASTAMAVDSGFRTTTVETAVRRLHTELSATNVRTSPLAIETRDQIEDFLAVTPTQPLP